MNDISNRRDLDFKDLLDNGYPKDLIDNIRATNFTSLYFVSMTKRSDPKFMKPLLYATKNELGTYSIYTFCIGSLKTDPKLAEEIIQSNEIELIKGSPLIKNSDFVLQHISSCPELINYASTNILINNSNEIMELALNKDNSMLLNTITKNPEITKFLIENSPELCSNEDFMSKAIINNASCFEYLSEDLKENRTFFNDIYKQNKDVVDYTIKNSNEFSKTTLTIAKDVVIDNLSDESITGFSDANNKLKEEMEKSSSFELEGKEEVAKKIENKIAQNDRHIEFIKKLKSGELDPVRAARLMKVLCKDMSPEHKKEIEQILSLNDKITEKENEKDNPKKEAPEELTNKVNKTEPEELTNSSDDTEQVR